MKKVILLSFLIISSLSALMAQKSKTTVPTKTQPVTEQPKVEEKPQSLNPMAEHYYKKYTVASRWNDLDVAKDALYDLIVEYPGSDSLIFALAIYYYENEKFASSALVGQTLLTRTPKNTQLLELVAASYEGLNIADRALEHYESLYLINNDSFILYKMTFLQYSLKKYQECMTNIDILLAKPEADKLKVQYNDAAGKPKEYVIRVPLLNEKGLVYKDQKDNVNAKKAFEQALALAPDFVAAKQNLASLKP